MPAFRAILHPTDFSAGSDCAFQLARSLAREGGARLHVLHVRGRPMMGSVEGTILPAVEPSSEELTARLRQLEASAPDVAVQTELVFPGDPATEIVRVAGQIHADLIVMGTRGQTGLRRFLMGSVAEQVLRRAPCMVVAVRAPIGPEKTADCPGPKNGTEELEAMLQLRLSGQVRNFHLETTDGGLILHGRAQSYHAKQLAREMVAEATKLPIVANEIEVSGGG